MMTEKTSLYFLKLGGSLITDKTRPHTPRLEVMDRLAGEIARAIELNPHLRLILGHGAGSYGHVAASRYDTRKGVSTAEEWLGFVEVWRVSVTLNRLVSEALFRAGLPAFVFPPSASVLAGGGVVQEWNLEPIHRALNAGLLPVIYGDTVFDSIKGGTILSTEDLFAHLAQKLKPERILLAGLEEGVWADFPVCEKFLPEITPNAFVDGSISLSGSAAADVTGGMRSKVEHSLALVQQISGLEILIFSGKEPGAVEKTLLGERLGTRIRSNLG
jgi:isopentenyl phosphate kinase